MEVINKGLFKVEDSCYLPYETIHYELCLYLNPEDYIKLIPFFKENKMLHNPKIYTVAEFENISSLFNKNFADGIRYFLHFGAPYIKIKMGEFIPIYL